MAGLLPLASLIVKETKEAIYAKGLEVATSLSLPVTSWLAGDPTRSLYHFLAEILSQREDMAAEYIKAGFLHFAEGDWLSLLAKQVFNVDPIDATFASTDVVLTNNGGGLYMIEPGDLTVANGTTGKTYRNTTGGTISLGTTLLVHVVADEAGSGSSALVGQINTLVTTLLGVTCTNPTGAVGVDAESRTSLIDRCRGKLATLSANGAKDAYTYVVRTPSLAGTSAINRARSSADGQGGVTVYVAGPGGTVDGADIALAQAAVRLHAEPLGVTATVVSATGVTIAVTYELGVYASVGKTVDEIKVEIGKALAAMFLARPIGGDVIPPATGRIYHSMIESTIRSTFAEKCFHAKLTVPPIDTDLTANQVAVLGAVNGAITIVPDP